MKLAHLFRKTTHKNNLCMALAIPMWTIFCEMPLACDSSWQPELNFDIEGYGFMVSMAFVSGHSYSLTTSNEILLKQGKKTTFVAIQLCLLKS